MAERAKSHSGPKMTLPVNADFLEGVIAERNVLRYENERLRDALNTATSEGHCWEGHAWSDGFVVGCEGCDTMAEAANRTLKPEGDDA